MGLLESAKSLYRAHRRAALALGLAVAGAALVVTLWSFSTGDTEFFTAPVERGDIQAVVNATGTINAVTTVQVGSQVSGMVAELYADFNSRVKKDEVIARIDPAVFRTRVLQAEADLANAAAGVKSAEGDLAVAQANLEKAAAASREADLNRRRTLQLFEQGIASVEQRDSILVAYDTAVANQRAAEAQIMQTRARLDQARAQVEQRQAALEQARLDLEHTIIRAPIDGTVVARNVDRGQTVAASLQAPTLFTIAQDLTKMLVYAKTDESDVGRIRLGAEATFKVDSFPYDTFRGVVTQVRMNAYTVQNVVTYDTIIEFDNPDRKLLPGMTAYVTIPVASAHDVVKIPNGALRFSPDLTEEERRALLQKYGLLGEPARPASGGGTVEAQETQPRRGEGRGRMGAAGMARRSSGEKAEGVYQVIWKLNANNSLQPVRIKIGLTDFSFTALLEGDLKAGDRVVIGQTLKRRSNQPFSGQQRR